jgi:RimJ/RimL family protein N-acetyltransferase
METNRLILRRWLSRDLAPFTAINADPKVMQFLGPLKSAEETQAMIDRIEDGFNKNGFGLYATELKETSELIGFVGCSVPAFEAPFTPCIEIGWRLASQHWGKGLAAEGARAVLADMFTRTGIDEIVSFTAVINTKSISVMKKLSMQSDARDNFDHPKVAKDNPLYPHVLYRLHKNDR